MQMQPNYKKIPSICLVIKQLQHFVKKKDKTTLTDTLLMDTLFRKQEIVVSFVSGRLVAVCSINIKLLLTL